MIFIDYICGVLRVHILRYLKLKNTMYLIILKSLIFKKYYNIQISTKYCYTCIFNVS
jgi:hypothetical protein